MFVSNTSVKPIGFGSLVLLPGAASELPEGFGEKHPVVKFYLKWGFIKEVTGKAAKTGGAGAGPSNFDALPLKEKIAAVKKMNLEPLRNRADKLGVERTDTDTRFSLINKIVEKMTESEPEAAE